METSPVPENLLYVFPLSSTSNVRERRSVRFHPLSAGLRPPLSTRHLGQVPLRAVPARCSTPPGLQRSSPVRAILHFTPPLLTCDDMQLAASKPVKQRSKWSEVEYRGASRSRGDCPRVDKGGGGGPCFSGRTRLASTRRVGSSFRRSTATRCPAASWSPAARSGACSSTRWTSSSR